MNLLDELKSNNYAIIASNGYHSIDRGIMPVISMINKDKRFFSGLIVADKIVGKASAMLLSLSEVQEVYCIVLSKAGEEIFKKYKVKYHYEQLVDYIVNRKNDDMCPMEKTVKDIDDLDEAYKALKKKVEELHKNKQK